MRIASRLSSAALALSLMVAAVPVSAAAPAAPAPFDVKVMVFTLFENETQPWITNEKPTRTIPVKGAYAPVRCTDDGLCVTTTGMGKANAALSVSAVLNSDELDLSQAIFMSAGIAGTPPEVGTLGDAAWADWVIDFDLGHHVLPETPETAPTPGNIFSDMNSKAGTEAFRLNPDLVTLAFQTTKDLELPDNETAKAYRALYPHQENQVPNVMRCDTVTGDNYWHGTALSALASSLAKARSGGEATYCATQMEDSAVAAALHRAGYLNRYVALRTMSNFDQPHPGQTTSESLATNSGGFPLSIASEYKVGSAFAHHVMANREAVLALTSGAATESDITVVAVDTALTGPILLERGRTLARVDELAAALGATYKWLQGSQTVSVEKDGKVLTFPLVSGTALVDGVVSAAEVGARSYGGQHYVPLRFVAEQLGFTVTWDAEAGAVRVK